METTAGIITGRRVDQRTYQIRLNDPTLVRLDETLEVDGVAWNCSYVELGNPGSPHAVVHIPGLETYPEKELFELGRKLRSHEAFPKGANVNFYDMIGPDHLRERTFERGVEDFTYACGTGTGSMVTVLTLKGLVSGTGVRVDVPGGRLTIDVDLTAAEPEGGACETETARRVRNLYLTGPTNIVIKGEVTDEEVQL